MFVLCLQLTTTTNLLHNVGSLVGRYLIVADLISRLRSFLAWGYRCVFRSWSCWSDAATQLPEWL